MQWSTIITGLSQKGHTPEEIVAYINSPLVTLKTVATALNKKDAVDNPRSYIYNTIAKQKAPRPTSYYWPVHAKRVELGDEEFVNLFKANNCAKLSKMWNINKVHIEVYFSRYMQLRRGDLYAQRYTPVHLTPEMKEIKRAKKLAKVSTAEARKLF